MAISFNDIPQAWRVPGVLVEFDNSQAMQRATVMEYRALAAGQMLPAGTAKALTPYQITSAATARNLFGAGSMLAQTCEAFLSNNSVTRLMAVAVQDDESATAASGKVTITGSVVRAAPITLYIGGTSVRCAAQSGQSAAQIATAMAAAINAAPAMPCTASVEGDAEGVVTLSAKHKGEEGNTIDVRLSYYGESMPTGVAVVLTPFTGGAGNPDVAPLLASLGDDWYHVIAWPWLDRANLRALHTELTDRWGPLRHIDGMAFACKAGSYADVTAFGMGEEGQGNYVHISILECIGSPDLPWARAGMVAGVAAYYGNIDPARPFQTLPLQAALAPGMDARLTMQEQNLLLYSGIATTYVDAGGVVRVQRLITNYRESANGATDESYLNVNTLLTLSYLRFDFRARILRKYPRHKLASDSARIAPGQAVMTPKTGRAEAIAAFLDWEELGLVEKLDKFKEQLLCERDARDPDRLNWLMPPDLVNQFRVGAAQIQFRLEEKEDA